MAQNKKPSYGLSIIVITLVTLVLCAGMTALGLNLIGVSFFAASNPISFVSGAAPATATAMNEEDDIPPPGGTPTGEIPPRPPTFDITQMYSVPTSEIPPDAPTLELAPTPIEGVPTFEARNPVTPEAAWVTYTDAIYGFSFEYPSNWKLKVPDGPRAPNAPEGTNIQILNYDDVETKSEFTDDLLKVEILVSRFPSEFSALDEWAENYRTSFSAVGITFSPVENITVNNVSGIRWVGVYPAAPEGTEEVLFLKDGWLYRINAYPSSSNQIASFNQIVSSFQIP